LLDTVFIQALLTSQERAALAEQKADATEQKRQAAEAEIARGTVSRKEISSSRHEIRVFPQIGFLESIHKQVNALNSKML
jgi:hypothetical protein